MQEKRASMHEMATKCDASHKHLLSLQQLAAHRCHLIQAFTLSLLCPFPYSSEGKTRQPSPFWVIYIFTGQKDKWGTVPACGLIPVLHCEMYTFLSPTKITASENPSSYYLGYFPFLWRLPVNFQDTRYIPCHPELRDSGCIWERRMAIPSYL